MKIGSLEQTQNDFLLFVQEKQTKQENIDKNVYLGCRKPDDGWGHQPEDTTQAIILPVHDPLATIPHPK